MNERDVNLLLDIKDEAIYLLEVLEKEDLDSFLKNRGSQ
jgi:hypothetical protein